MTLIFNRPTVYPTLEAYFESAKMADNALKLMKISELVNKYRDFTDSEKLYYYTIKVIHEIHI